MDSRQFPWDHTIVSGYVLHSELCPLWAENAALLRESQILQDRWTMAVESCIRTRYLCLAFLWVVLLTTLVVGILQTQQEAHANGATQPVVKEERVGPYLLQIGILPGRPKVGNLHLVVLVQDGQGEQVIRNAAVIVTATGPEGATDAGPIQALNTLQNPDSYETNVSLDQAGSWNFTFEIFSELGEGRLDLPLQVTESGGISLTWVAAAAIAVMAFAVWVWSRFNKKPRTRVNQEKLE